MVVAYSVTSQTIETLYRQSLLLKTEKWHFNLQILYQAWLPYCAECILPFVSLCPKVAMAMAYGWIWKMPID